MKPICYVSFPKFSFSLLLSVATFGEAFRYTSTSIGTSVTFARPLLTQNYEQNYVLLKHQKQFVRFIGGQTNCLTQEN